MSRSVVEVRDVAPGDAETLARGLRAQDLAELIAGGDRDPLAVIEQSIASSVWCKTVTADGELGCIFGVAPGGTILTPAGVPWMLGTDLVTQHRRALARMAPRYIRSMLRDYSHLYNCVHAKNTAAVRWLRRAGFHLHPAHAHPETGEPFHFFEMT